MTLNEFKNKVQNMSEQDFKTFQNLMYRSMELMNEFKRLFNLDIE